MGKGLRSLRAKRFDQAVRRIEHAIEIYPPLGELFSTHSYLGECRLGMGRTKEALECLESAHRRAEPIAFSEVERARYRRNAGLLAGLLRKLGEDARADDVRREAEAALNMPGGVKDVR